MNIITIKVRSDDLTILSDLLSIEEEQFKEAQVDTSTQLHKNWGELLEDAGSLGEIIISIDRIKEAIEDGQPD